MGIAMPISNMHGSRPKGQGFNILMTEEQFDQRLECINQLVDRKPPTMADITQNQANLINAIKKNERNRGAT